MEIGLVFLVGVFIGVMIVLLISRFHLIGSLRVDRSDPDEPCIFLELDKRLGDVTPKKYVVLKVKLENFIPHK